MRQWGDEMRSLNVNRRKSFEGLGMWLEEARICCPEDVSIILIGNKADMEDEYNGGEKLMWKINRRVVSYDEGEKFADKNGLVFLEVTCKAGKSVIQVVRIYYCLKGNWLFEKRKKLGKEREIFFSNENFLF